MRRRNLAIVLFAVAAVIVVLFGLARGNNGKAPHAVTTTVVGLSKGLSTKGAFLQPATDVVTVPADSDCKAIIPTDPSPSCQAFDIGGAEYAWTVEQNGAARPVTSLLRRDTPTTWTRLLRADGKNPNVDTVNVRVDDITGDGKVEIIFGFHHGNDLSVDVAAVTGKVELHLELGAGQALVGGGQLITYTRTKTPGRFDRSEVKSVKGKLTVTKHEEVPGPANGNL